MPEVKVTNDGRYEALCRSILDRQKKIIIHIAVITSLLLKIADQFLVLIAGILASKFPYKGKENSIHHVFCMR